MRNEIIREKEKKEKKKYIKCMTEPNVLSEVTSVHSIDFYYECSLSNEEGKW